MSSRRMITKIGVTPARHQEALWVPFLGFGESPGNAAFSSLHEGTTSNDAVSGKALPGERFGEGPMNREVNFGLN